MDSKTSHTPAPWQAIAVDGPDTKFIYADGAIPCNYRDSEGVERTAYTRLVAIVYGTAPEQRDSDAPIGRQEANAELIVRAVNCHAELVDHHKAVLNYASDLLCHMDAENPAFNYVKAIHHEAKIAVAKVEGRA